MINGKTVVLGVSGSIAAYKAPSLASQLVKEGADVHVILTKNGAKFVTPITFETITGNKCLIDTFDRNFKFDVEHISIAKKADVFIIAPASANIIAKAANGIADDMLSTTLLASTCVKIIAPAMNVNMYRNPITQYNLKKLKDFGFTVIPPVKGLLACKAIGEGKLPDTDILYSYIEKAAHINNDLSGKKVLVTAGATIQNIDPVRFITNHSTGKMGFALAKACMLRGADVTVIKANTSANIPMFVNVIETESAEDMFNAVKNNYLNNDIIFMAAAVSDYTPEKFSNEKIKKSDSNMSISLKRTDDILKYLGENKKDNQFICGFSMETENLIENSKEKLIKKNVDMIVANSLSEDGAGFSSDTNKVSIITKNEIIQSEKMSKFDVADKIINEVLKCQML